MLSKDVTLKTKESFASPDAKVLNQSFVRVFLFQNGLALMFMSEESRQQSSVN